MKRTLIFLIGILSTYAMSAYSQAYSPAPTDLASRTFGGEAGKPLSGKVIYLNPGHGSWGPNDRPCATIPYPNLKSTGRPDTCGFYESNTDLWKIEELRDRLVAAGAKVIMSRIGNGPYPYVSGASNASDYNRSLTVICEEVEQQLKAPGGGVDMFFSLHSNATGDGTMTNYPLMLYRGTDALDYVPNSRSMAENVWDKHVDYMYANGFEYQSLFTQSRYVKGDITFYGSSTTRYSNTSHIYYTGYLGVLKHGAPGFLSEGFFHTYQPARHRALNRDYCRQEGLRAYRGIMSYFKVTDNTLAATTGCIMGAVKDKSKSVNNTLYNYKSGTPDAFYPVMGATVRLRKMSAPTVVVATYTTDQNYNGLFTFWDLVPGDYYLDVKADGYATVNGSGTNNCITTYTNGYAESNSTTTYKVTVTAGKTVYPYVYMTAGESTDFAEGGVTPPVEPDKAYAMALKCNGTIEQLTDKTIRRAIYRNGYLYVLALGGDNVPYVFRINTTDISDVFMYSTTGCTAYGFGVYTDVLRISDIALTSDGVLVGCNKEAVGFSSSSEYPQNYWKVYRWTSEHADPEVLQGRYSSFSGNHGNAYVGETMTWQGTSTAGKAVTISSRNESGYEVARYVVATISGSTMNAVHNKLQTSSDYKEEPNISIFGGHVTLNPAPTSTQYIADGNGIEPYIWTPNATAAGVITYNSTLPTTLSHVSANGGTWFEVGAKKMMAYPTNSAAGTNTGVQVLNITSGLASATHVETGSATTLEATDYDYEMAAGDYRDTVLTLYLLRDNHLYIWDNYVEPVIPTVSVTGIMLDKGNLRLSRESTETLIATVLPADATNKNYSWSSSDPEVATITGEGLVTAVATGTATITATTDDGSHTAICVVNVYTPITEITVTPTPVNVPGIGHTVQLVAQVTPADADNQAVTWTTADEDKATVDASGIVTGGVPGSVTITCTANENASIHADAAVNVQMAGRYTVGTEGQHFASLRSAVDQFETTQSAAPSNLVGDVTLAIATDLNEAATGLWNTSNYSLTIEPEANTSPTVTYTGSGSGVRGGLVLGSSTLGNTSLVSKETKNITINGSSSADEQRQLKFVWSGTSNNAYEGPVVLYGNVHDCAIENAELLNNKSSGSAYAYSLLIRAEQNNVSGTRPHDIEVSNNHLESFKHASSQSVYISGDYATSGTSVVEASSPYNIRLAKNEIVATTRGIFLEGAKDIDIEENIFDVKQLAGTGYLTNGIYGYLTWGNVNIRKNRFYRLHTVNTYPMSSQSVRYGIHGLTLGGYATYHVENNYISGLDALQGSSAKYNVVGIYVEANSTASICHNTIVLPKLKQYPKNTSNAHAGGVTACIYSGNSRTEIKNNILVSRETAGTNAVIYSIYAPDSKWDYNIFEYPESNANAYVWAGYYSSNTHYNHDFESGYQSRSDGVNSDRNSHRLTEIHFANVDECDLALVGDETELDRLKVANSISGITTDILGTKRSETTPYAGAYEVFVWEDGNEVDIVDWHEQWLEINLNAVTGMTDYAVAPRVEINGLPAAVEVVDNDKHPGTPLRTYRVTPTEPLEQNENFTISVIVNGTALAKHEYKMPIIVSTDAELTSLPDTQADLWVRDGATLTIGANLTTSGRVVVNADSRLVIPSAMSLSVEALYLRSRYDKVAELVDEGMLTATSFYFTKMLADKDRYYFLSVPYEMPNAGTGLYLTNGLRLKYDSSYRLKYYNGAARANQGYNEANWAKISAEADLNPMTGYEMLTSANNYREYLFPMNYVAKANTQSTDVSSHVLGSDIHPIHGGWNWIAHPFTHTYRGKLTYEAAASDYYKDMYLTMHNTDGTYYQEYSGFGDVEIPPFTPFFVQVKQLGVGENTGTVTFERSFAAAPAPAREMRSLLADRDTTIWGRITLQGESTADNTGIRIHPQHTASYQAELDLEKWYTAGSRVQVYSLAYGDRLAFVAANDSMATTAISLGYFAPEAGTMTIAYRSRQDDFLRVSAVWLRDNETGKEVEITNTPYTFSSSAGEFNSRFVLRYELLPLPSVDVPTGLEEVQSAADAGQTDTYDVLGRRVGDTHEGQVYIQVNNRTGKVTKLAR